MVHFFFYDKDDEESICKFLASDDLPDEVARMNIYGPLDANKSNYGVLNTMLKNSSKKLDEIKISRFSEESPEFLAFLVLICNKTNSLSLEDCKLSTGACACLMAAMLSCDGIRSFSIKQRRGITMLNGEAKILLEGVAGSPCLESFDLDVFEPDVSVGGYLTQALRRNQSLKKISIDTTSFTDECRNILNASILGPKMKEIYVVECGQVRVPLLLDELQDVLCRKDCTVEKLNLDGATFATRGSWYGSMIQNASVKSLSVRETAHNWHELKEIISLFGSLEELELDDHNITKLSFLDPLLFSGKSSKLKSLDVSDNRINEEEMKRFIKKLRKLKGLKHLAIGNNSWEESDSVKTALIDALRQNTDLEHVDFDGKDLPLDLNRGGRRAFESSQQPFPTNLLPLVLERASKISYYEYSDCWGDPTNEEPRADVVFWMVQRIVPQL